MKNRTLLGQILTVIIYLYNIAAVGLVVVMIASLLGSNSIADKYGDTVPSLTGINPLGAILSFLFIGVVWVIFYFILKKIRDATGFINESNKSEVFSENKSEIKKPINYKYIIFGIIILLVSVYIYQNSNSLLNSTYKKDSITNKSVEEKLITNESIQKYKVEGKIFNVHPSQLEKFLKAYPSAIKKLDFNDESTPFEVKIKEANLLNGYEAIFELNRLIESNPNNPMLWKVYYILADRKQFNDDYSGALEDINTAIKIHPNPDYTKNSFTILFKFKIFYLQMLNKHKTAISFINEIIKNNPKIDIKNSLIEDRGDSKLSLKLYKSAFLDYELICKSDCDGNNFGKMAEIKVKLNDLKSALLLYDKAIYKQTTSFELFFDRAGIKYRLKDYYGALSDYNQSFINSGVDLKGDNSVGTDGYRIKEKVFLRTGRIKMKLGDNNGACKDFKTARNYSTSNYIANNYVKKMEKKVDCFFYSTYGVKNKCDDSIDCHLN